MPGFGGPIGVFRGSQPRVNADGIDFDDNHDPYEHNIFSLDDIFTQDKDEYAQEAEGFSNPDEKVEEPDDGYEEPDDVGEGPSGDAPLTYDGGTSIPGLLTREHLVKQSCPEIHAKINTHLKERKAVFFMPHDVEESNDYIHGVPTYRLHLFGPLMDGTKAHVVVEDIDVTFGVRIPDRPAASALLSKAGKARLEQIDPEVKRKQKFSDQMHQIFEEQSSVRIKRIDDFDALPAFGYHVEPCAFKRVHTNDLKQRKDAIAAIRSHGFDTVMDDRSSYYRKACREYGLPLTDWAILKNYRYAQGRSEYDPISQHVLRISVKDISPLINPMASKEEREKKTKIKRDNPHLLKDRTLVMAWDIETHSSRKTGDLPRACNPEDKIFCIGYTLHWKDSPEVLHRVCLVDKPAHPDARWTTVICGTEKNIIRAHGIVHRAFSPDTTIDFNGSEYDMPFVAERAFQNDDLGFLFDQMSAIPRRRQTSESVYKWNFRRDIKIKITPEETFYSSFLKMPGCVPIDVRVCFKKLYPKSEVAKGSSLNFYLKECKLPGKADMPVTRMWRGYESGDPEMMRKILHYCAVDCVRCQQLMCARGVINDGREVATLAFVSYGDSHYYAGGMKVCNMLITYAIAKGIVCSNIAQEKAEKGKYPGAWVFPPAKGLENKRPVTGIDAASLYPSIIMAFNLSPEKIVLREEQAEELRAEGKSLHPISFMFNGRNVRGWSVRHKDVPAAIGLFPSILIDLFAKRKEMKKALEPLQKAKDLLELITGEAKKSSISIGEAITRVKEQCRATVADGDKNLAKLRGDARASRICAGQIADAAAKIAAIALLEIQVAEAGGEADEVITTEYGKISFSYEAINSKQKALKVYMNTFYGESGNSRSPFFLLQLAGGVTSAGQVVIKTTWDFARKKGFKLKYGDTDSLYVIAPDKHYEKCDADYLEKRITKEEYWSEMVKITMTVIEEFLEELNAFLVTEFDTRYLTFAYEDVLFPVDFTGKKKYFGIAHINIPNFRPKKLFIRGIDVVKQGQTELSKEIGGRIMWTAMKIENVKTIDEIVEDTLKDAVTNGTQWKFEHFIQSDAWKPDKNNPSVQRFIARMKVRHAAELAENKRLIAAGKPTKPYLYEIPEAGERFRSVIVKRGADFDRRGFRSKPRKGDVMEFAHAAKELGTEVDVAFYMEHYVAGLCARFINGADRFQPPASTRLDEKAIDKFAQKKAKKHLDDIIRGAGGANKKTIAARGHAYKRAYREAAKVVSHELATELGATMDVLHGDHLSYDLFLDDGADADADGENNEDDEAADDAAVVNPITKCVERLAAAAMDLAKTVTSCPDDELKRCEDLAARLGIAPNGCDIGSPNTSRNLYRLHAAMTVPARKVGMRRRHMTARDINQNALLAQETAARTMIANAIPAVSEAAMKFEMDLDRLVEKFRAEEHAANPVLNGGAPPSAQLETAQLETAQLETLPQTTISFDDADKEALRALRRGWHCLVGVEITRARDATLEQWLTRIRNKRVGVIGKPTTEIKKGIVAAGAKWATAAAARSAVPVGTPRL